MPHLQNGLYPLKPLVPCPVSTAQTTNHNQKNGKAGVRANTVWPKQTVTTQMRVREMLRTTRIKPILRLVRMRTMTKGLMILTFLSRAMNLALVLTTTETMKTIILKMTIITNTTAMTFTNIMTDMTII
jgi:hypothetical protein